MIYPIMEGALRSLLVALAVGAGLWAFRVRNVLAQKAAWGLVLVAAIVMPLLVPLAARWQIVPDSATLLLPVHSLRLLATPHPLPQSPIPAAVQTPQQTPPPPAFDSSRASALAVVPSASVPSAALPNPGNARSPVAAQPTPARMNLTSANFVWLLYLAVSAALLFRLLYGLAAAFRLWHSAEPVLLSDAPHFASGLRLRSSSSVPSPVTIGSSIVLPADYIEWDAGKLRIVLAHERSHIRQGDFYLQLLAGVYSALVWFSPLGWWIKSELSDLAEAISDRAGLEQAVSRSSYAQILLEFAAAPRPTPIGVAMARTGSLTRRIERLLNDRAFRQAFAGGRRTLAAVLLVPLALFAATAFIRVQAAGQAPQPQAQPAAAPQAPTAVSPAPEPAAAPAPSEAEPAPLATVVPDVAPLATIVPDVAPLPPEPPQGAGAVQGQRSTTSQDHTFTYRNSSNGDSYAVITGAGREHMQFAAGDIHADQIDKARALAHGNFLWFTHEGKSYYVDDPSIVAQIRDMYQQMEVLGPEQQALVRGAQELARQQEAISRQRQQALASVDISKQKAELDAAMAKLQAKMAKAATGADLANLQRDLGQLQRELGQLQVQIQTQLQGQLQGKLGEEQGRMGAELGRLGAERGRLAAETDGRVKSIINDTLRNGTAKPVQ
jgi:beta-lactamase regulating signal transducer with metallopeptidase domain